MSIRWKLFVALFLLTSGAIAAVLLVAEREFYRWVEGEIRTRFENQMDGLLAARKERLAGLRETCTKLANHPAVRAGLKGGEDKDLRARFMEELMEQGTERPNRPRRSPAAADGPGTDADRRSLAAKAVPIVGVVDLEGTATVFGGSMRRAPGDRRRASSNLGQVPDSIDQDVAYVVLTHEVSKRTVVQELVVTRVTGEDGRPLGWFFLGRDAETPVERAFQQAERVTGRDVNSGLVAEGQWFVRGVPDEETAAIASQLSDRFWTSGKPETVNVHGVPLLAIARDLNPGSPIGKGYQVAFFPLGGFLVAMDRLHRVVLWIGVAAVFLTSFLAFLMARRFSRPIAELVAGTERVRQGDFAGDVVVRSRDEFGTLAAAFNAMTHDLALKERYREVLSKTSDPSVARQLIDGQLELGGEVRQAAVLFCDIRGFTAMTEGMPPAEVIGFLNEHMTALTRTVYRHGGVVDKFVGDLIMAIFGAPNSHGDDALRAARCALEMIRVRKELDASTGRVVEIGIGVAYGELVAGCMGSKDRLNYTVLGERVNLASRLCSDALAGEVIVDGAIAAALDGSIDAGPREPVILKGFSAPVESFAIRAKE